MVSTSAFPATTCYQHYSMGSSLGWGFNFQAVECGIFWSSLSGVFSRYISFLPLLISYWFSQPNKANINAISTLSNNSWAVSSYFVVYNMLHVRCLICFYVICTQLEPGHLNICTEDVQFAVQGKDCKKILNCAFQCHYYKYFYHHFTPMWKPCCTNSCETNTGALLVFPWRKISIHSVHFRNAEQLYNVKSTEWLNISFCVLGVVHRWKGDGGEGVCAKTECVELFKQEVVLFSSSETKSGRKRSRAIVF